MSVEELGGTSVRADTHIIVTEHGWVDLKGKALDERARALTSIAHPDFREALARRHRDGPGRADAAHG